MNDKRATSPVLSKNQLMCFCRFIHPNCKQVEADRSFPSTALSQSNSDSLLAEFSQITVVVLYECLPTIYLPWGRVIPSLNLHMLLLTLKGHATL